MLPKFWGDESYGRIVEYLSPLGGPLLYSMTSSINYIRIYTEESG